MNKFISSEQRYGEKLSSDAIFFRSIALEIDNNPDSIENYFEHPAISPLAHDLAFTCLDRVKFVEALSYGDPGVLIACPGPALAGLMVQQLGNDSQKEDFFGFVSREKARTFLAVTEPNKGSDAGMMQTRLLPGKTKNSFLIEGEKWLVGHGATGLSGVLVARRAEGPLGICAVLLGPEDLKQVDQVHREKLKMIGLRGAQISRMRFDQLEISADKILGHHLSPMNRGMMALIKTFNEMRPGVAAFAVGQAQAMLDYAVLYLDINTAGRILLNRLNLELHGVRDLLHHAAWEIIRNPMDGSKSSLAKLRSTHMIEKIANAILQVSDQSVFVDHPLIRKWSRDAFAYEYMEGTSIIQMKNIYQGLVHQKYRNMA